MKEMIENQIIFKRHLHTKRYSNGQLAVYVHDYNGEPIAELSIMHNLVELAPNEFILKDYSENENLAREFLESSQFISTNRFILVGSHFCPVCQTGS